MTDNLQYDCTECPGYCCAYGLINVEPGTYGKLAEHLGLTEEEFDAQYLVDVGSKRHKDMKRRYDELLDTEFCTFFDQENRRCSVYEHRPDVCRAHPHPSSLRCEWYDRQNIESELAGKKVIHLKVMPFDLPTNYPVYKQKDDTKLRQRYDEDPDNPVMTKRKKKATKRVGLL